MKRNKKWKNFLYFFCMIGVVSLVFSKVSVQAEEITEEVSEDVGQTVNETKELQEFSFTDENGNLFTYILDDEGNVTIVGITVSGQSLVIPTLIADAPVVAIANGTARVVKNPEITIPELRINCPTIGTNAFRDLNIGTLVIGENVTTFSVGIGGDYGIAFTYGQFAKSTIEKVIFQATELVIRYTTGNTSDEFQGPFVETKIGMLEIGNNVKVIPELLFSDAIMELEELVLQVERIDAYAFCSEDISIEHLTIGENVKIFAEYSNSSELLHNWKQFADCTIGHLSYEATNAEVINDVKEANDISVSFYGPFDSATINAFTIGESVVSIPDFLLKGAKAQIEVLDLHLPDIGAMAFSGSNINIGKLILEEEVEIFHKTPNGNENYQYWEQFSYAAIGEVYYNIPSLTLENEVGQDRSCYGPFFRSEIGHLFLSEKVQRYPAYCFLDAYLEQEELEIHAESIGVRAFSGKSISIGTLTIGTEVQTFEYINQSSSICFRQFMDCTIDTLIYLPICAETGEKCYKGVFETATIGNLVIDSSVERIPNYLFYNIIMEMEDFTVNVPEIGYQSFASEGIIFETLTIGEDVTVFETDTNGFNQAFSKNTIGMLYYNPLSAQLDSFSGTAYGPFSYGATINGLVIGENVEVIPYGCFRDAKMELTELWIEKADIGYVAFRGSKIHIGSLYIGNAVSYLGISSNEMNCFRGTTIDLLHYNSNVIESEWSTGSGSYGMFSHAIIGQLQIGEDVEVIPAFWFCNATLIQEELILACDFSYYSFYGENIKIGTLILNGDMAEFRGGGGYNRAFSYATIETVIYNLPCTVFKNIVDGPFYNTNITTFILGENVEYIDYRLLRENTITNCYVYAINGSEKFLSQNFTESYLPICTNLYIHYNSDFKDFFSKEVTEYHWLCVDYFDTTYGEKIYDEETGEYSIELFKTCNNCGYEEQGVEELDGSYDVTISIPIEILLHFDAEQKSYIGQEMIYAYGTLGNAYDGIKLVIDTEALDYGSAMIDERIYDISDYLSGTFTSGEFALFDIKQLLENADHIKEGNIDHVYQEQMTVSIDAMAFLEGGAGEYQISIPLRFELIK